MAMVELVGASKRYGTTEALASVNLQVKKGEFLTLLGPSGSGKTTILNLIAGLIQPTAGQIFIEGRDATKLPPGERSLGMMFQNYALMPHMTVFDNIAFPLQVRKVPAAEIEARVMEVLSLVRLPNIAKRYPKELSGGQQQRVSLARCIVYKPALILMDEPLGALDKKLREQMQLEIKRIHAELGITMLNVTHDQEEALTLSDRIVLMNGGKIEQTGAPSELYFTPRTIFAADFIGEANFLQGVIAQTDEDRVVVDSECGRLECVNRVPENAIKGSDVSVLIRPENLALTDVGTMPPPESPSNVLRGSIVDHLILGAIVKHRVRLGSGKELSVQQANHPGTRVFHKDEAVQVSFNPASAVVLSLRKAAA